MSLSGRRRRAAGAAKAAGVEALLVTHLEDVRWLCGFTGSNAALVLVCAGRMRAMLFTDGRYTAQAKAEAVGIGVEIAAKPALIAACEWLAAAGVARCGFDDSNYFSRVFHSRTGMAPRRFSRQPAAGLS